MPKVGRVVPPSGTGQSIELDAMKVPSTPDLPPGNTVPYFWNSAGEWKEGTQLLVGLEANLPTATGSKKFYWCTDSQKLYCDDGEYEPLGV